MKSCKRQTPFNLNLPLNDKFVIAFSGGIDSLSLVAFMSEEERNEVLEDAGLDPDDFDF